MPDETVSPTEALAALNQLFDGAAQPASIKLLHEALVYAQQDVEVAPEVAAELHCRLGNVLQNTLQGAIEYCNVALTIFTRTQGSRCWALLQNSLAQVYQARLEGSRQANLEQAVRCCQNALQVHILGNSPVERAITQVTLGNVYTHLEYYTSGHRYMTEQALEQYHDASQILTEEVFPTYWAIIQQGLSMAYCLRIDGKKCENLQLSIVHGQSALRLLTRAMNPFEWAAAHAHLGEAYRQATLYADLQELYSGLPVMQEQALRHMEAALQVYTRHTYPLQWARTQRFLGLIYLDRVQDKRYENLAWAKACFEAYLQIFNREYSPQDWANGQRLLKLVSLSPQIKRNRKISRQHPEQSLETFIDQ